MFLLFLTNVADDSHGRPRFHSLTAAYHWGVQVESLFFHTKIGPEEIDPASLKVASFHSLTAAYHWGVQVESEAKS